MEEIGSKNVDIKLINEKIEKEWQNYENASKEDGCDIPKPIEYTEELNQEKEDLLA